MSRRARHPPAASRRTRRAGQPSQSPPATLAESPKIVSNPIFRCEAGPSQPKPPPGDQLRCVYRPGSLYAFVHDPAAGGDGISKPLPLPPCRAHRAGSHVPALQVGTALVAGSPHGRVLRRAAPQDPFLAAYVACSKSDKHDAAGVDRRQQKQRQGRKKCTTKKKEEDGKEGEEVVRGCGVWSGWAAGAKYAGAMSCRYGCAVAEQQQGDTSVAAAAKKEAAAEDVAAGLTLDLSWAPVVLSARVLERRREQR